MSLGFDWTFNTAVSLLSIAIPLAAFVWEFVVVRRKRIGFRVQMDTLATDTAHAPHANVLARMRQNGRELIEPSFVLLRVENAGWMPIVEDDYLTSQFDRTGIRVTFRNRKVVGMAVTELSQPELRYFFVMGTGDDETMAAEGFEIGQEGDSGVINLPKVKLNPRAHYKVLAVLERQAGNPGDTFPDPVFSADVSGRHIRWLGWLAQLKIAQTESHTFASRPAKLGIGLLATAVLAQATLALFWSENPPPLDCVGGTLHLHGSTAFKPAITKAAQKYVQLCKGRGAGIPIDDGTFRGSTEGLGELERAGDKAGKSGTTGLGDHITFTDGEAAPGHPQLLSRPVVLSLFTLVTRPDQKVKSLTLQQIRDIYAGTTRDWSDVRGKPGAIHLIGRSSGSGTRTTLVERVLNHKETPPPTTRDCAALKRDQPGACEVDTTEALLQEVAKHPNSIGYSEVSSAMTAKGVVRLAIDQAPATLTGIKDGKYPYWQVEFAYTYGELPAGSIAAAFLRYLTDQGGKDILRELGNRPCLETEYPLKCTPS
ncbi:substrate-binding domain-containing protein [Actinomadura roseirufa]|uniref:substrate-binding domain-containing protein n=1 Tax=Actinomadura roseirufa TaxID=2094049 RepID=UPI001A9557DE|nr:substrate-binding domain-containing protein [Actinomadura roseirufa]